ncbi:hypothetical protein EV356DRAFT_512191 [Viridothelium virens]|uniref:Uncharacterized protein n=1 Tax=Viridothelium virens TaxID=1048519 RepID=A0A6A6HH81_VIRVR|nr:hypothetical protein EV356DRAFT_512191 [Viridothelium virens]
MSTSSAQAINSSSSSSRVPPGTVLFPLPIPERKIPTMASVSPFGGPCMYTGQDAYHWSSCYCVDDSGQVSSHGPLPVLGQIQNTGETLLQTMARLSQYSLSACKLQLENEAGSMELSGIWIRGEKRDVILTVSHFPKPKDNGNAQMITAKVYTDFLGNLTLHTPSIQCEIFLDFNNPSGPKDFAIFTPCKNQPTRSPKQAIPLTSIMPDTGLLSGKVVSFGYNGAVAPALPGHPDPQACPSCSCENCWYGSGNTIREKVNHTIKAPDPRILAAGHRVMTVGEWSPSPNPHQPLHTATGWYGISGSGMYTRDNHNQFKEASLKDQMSIKIER